jgi:hypothetical protein
MSEQEAGPLLPCPFCSGEAKIFRSVVTTTVFCPHTNCHVGPSAKAYSDSEAIDTWNRRTVPDLAIPADVAEAVRLVCNALERRMGPQLEIDTLRRWLDKQAERGE